MNAKDLAKGKDIPEVYGLGEAGLFDEFFYFLDRFEFTKLFMELEPESKKRNSPVPFMGIIPISWISINHDRNKDGTTKLSLS